MAQRFLLTENVRRNVDSGVVQSLEVAFVVARVLVHGSAGADLSALQVVNVLKAAWIRMRVEPERYSLTDDVSFVLIPVERAADQDHTRL